MPDTRNMFNLRAAGWDKAHPHDPGKLRAMLELSCVAEGADILDAGCGTGVLVPYLLERKPRYVLGVDFAEQMIEVARSKLQDPRVEFRCADVLELSGVSFDCCFLFNVYPHINEPKRLFAHLTGLLRPEGRLVVSHTRGFSGGGSFLFGGEYPNRAIVRLMRPYFRVDATIDNPALLMVSGVRR